MTGPALAAEGYELHIATPPYWKGARPYGRHDRRVGPWRAMVRAMPYAEAPVRWHRGLEAITATPGITPGSPKTAGTTLARYAPRPGSSRL